MHPSFEDCAHTNVAMKCHESKLDHARCPKPCSQQLPCGHPCPESCGMCSRRKGHGSCKAKCKRVLFCGHTCGKACHEGPCQACNMKCVVRCLHSKCPKKCPEPCAPCMECCAWKCVHEGKCEVICGAPCVRKRCDLRCEKFLECGHRSPSVCGEKCLQSSFCQISSLDSDPIILLPCNHFYCMSTLDGVMELDKEGFTPDGKPSTTPKSCPECRQVIHNVFRYGSVQKLAEISLLQRKHTMSCERKLQSVLKELDSLKIDAKIKRLKKLLSNVRASPMMAVYDAVPNDYRHEF